MCCFDFPQFIVSLSCTKSNLQRHIRTIYLVYGFKTLPYSLYSGFIFQYIKKLGGFKETHGSHPFGGGKACNFNFRSDFVIAEEGAEAEDEKVPAHDAAAADADADG